MGKVKIKPSELSHEQFYYFIKTSDGDYYENDEVDWECCENYCIFAKECVNNTYLVFAPELQREIVAKLLKSGGITEEELCPFLEKAEEQERSDDFYLLDEDELIMNPFGLEDYEDFPLIEFAEVLGLSVENGKLSYKNFSYMYELGDVELSIIELLEALGYHVSNYCINCSFPRPSGAEVFLIPKPEL